MTKNQLVSDIILRITQGKPSDDLELEPRQVAYWIDMVLGALIKLDIEDALAQKRGMIDPSYICWDKEVPVKVDYINDNRSDFYFDLEKCPINISRDAGVIRINTTDGDGVDKMNMLEIDNLSKMRFSKYSLENIKYTRVKQRIHLFGLTEDTYHLVKFDVAYIPTPDLLEDMDDDDEVFIGEDILPKVAEEVEKIARRQVYQSGIDQENDGQQDLNSNV